LCAEIPGFGGKLSGGWKASAELVDELSKRRSETNYDERNVPKYTLPDPLAMADGATVSNARKWRTERRAEILELFRTHVYGRTPLGRPENMTFEVFDLERKALAGTATRKQVTVNFAGKEDGPRMDILIYLPNSGKKPVPTFVLLNFGGNHTINSDPAIKLSTRWMRPGRGGSVNNRATEKSRGTSSSSYPGARVRRATPSGVSSSVATVSRPSTTATSIRTSTMASRTACTRRSTGSPGASGAPMPGVLSAPGPGG
jgi:hypothetical protein